MNHKQVGMCGNSQNDLELKWLLHAYNIIREPENSSQLRMLLRTIKKPTDRHYNAGDIYVLRIFNIV